MKILESRSEQLYKLRRWPGISPKQPTDWHEQSADQAIKRPLNNLFLFYYLKFITSGAFSSLLSHCPLFCCSTSFSFARLFLNLFCLFSNFYLLSSSPTYLPISITDHRPVQLDSNLKQAKFDLDTWNEAKRFNWKQYNSTIRRWFKGLTLFNQLAIGEAKYKEVGPLISKIRL